MCLPPKTNGWIPKMMGLGKGGTFWNMAIFGIHFWGYTLHNRWHPFIRPLSSPWITVSPSKSKMILDLRHRQRLMGRNTPKRRVTSLVKHLWNILKLVDIVGVTLINLQTWEPTWWKFIFFAIALHFHHGTPCKSMKCQVGGNLANQLVEVLKSYLQLYLKRNRWSVIRLPPGYSPSGSFMMIAFLPENLSELRCPLPCNILGPMIPMIQSIFWEIYMQPTCKPHTNSLKKSQRHFFFPGGFPYDPGTLGTVPGYPFPRHLVIFHRCDSDSNTIFQVIWMPLSGTGHFF